MVSPTALTKRTVLDSAAYRVVIISYPHVLTRRFSREPDKRKILPSEESITFLTNEREGWKKVRSRAQSNDLFKQQCFPVVDSVEPR